MTCRDVYQPELIGGNTGWALFPRWQLLTDPNLKPIEAVASSRHLLTDAHPGKLGVARWIWEDWKSVL